MNHSLRNAAIDPIWDSWHVKQLLFEYSEHSALINVSPPCGIALGSRALRAVLVLWIVDSGAQQQVCCPHASVWQFRNGMTVDLVPHGTANAGTEPCSRKTGLCPA